METMEVIDVPQAIRARDFARLRDTLVGDPSKRCKGGSRVEVLRGLCMFSAPVVEFVTSLWGSTGWSSTTHVSRNRSHG